MTDETASPQLFWAEDGSPRSGRFGDVYFSKDDGLSETRAVFLGGCGMPDVWAGRTQFTVGELGFGTGLNIIALIEMWRAHRPAGGLLNVFSVEGYPLTRDEAARALSAWPELAQTANAILAQWPTARPGMHRIDLPDWGVCIDLAIGEVEWALDQWQGRADAWFLDGFSPALNPGMWSEEIMARIGALSAPGAHLATFTVAGAVRRALSAHGFSVEKRPGHGKKRERLEARFHGTPTPSPLPRIAIIGAGIAGASVARAAKAQAVVPVIIEADRPGAAASGFPAALVTPRLDAGDDYISGLYAQALERADQLYSRIEGAVLARGVIQLEQAPRDATRFDKISKQPLWSDGQMQRLDAAQSAVALDEIETPGALAMEGAFALRPEKVLADWLQDCPIITAHVCDMVRREDGWHLLDASGQTLTIADHVVVTAGWGSHALLPNLALSPIAGQADWIENTTGPVERPAAWGGYSVPTHNGLLYGATHVRGDEAPQPDEAASRHNWEVLQATLTARARRNAEGTRHCRTAVRATTPHRMPYSGAVDHGLWVLGGMGSRGFCASPLLAESLIAKLLDRPSPLPKNWTAKLTPIQTEQL